MLSTLRVLRSRVPSDIISKASTAGIHLCVRPTEPTGRRRSAVLWDRRVPLAASALPFSGINFLSTTGVTPPSSQGNAENVTIQDPIPEPPSPVVEAVDLPNCLNVFQKEEQLDSFLEVLTKVDEISRTKGLVDEVIPPIPTPPFSEVLQLDGNALQANGEPTFESLGLGGWTPVGMVEKCMEFVHVTCDIPWWGTIVIGTIVVRTLLFPLVILSQRNAARMNNHLPEMQEIQLKMSEARERGDRLDSARYAQEMMVFMKEKELNPFKNMLVPLAQAPLFISFFMALRAMSNLPVESLKQGGLFWFVDLTIPDQFYLLPITTCITLLVTIEVGTDAARLNSANLGMLKYLMRALPIIIFPFTITFPAAILVYWTSTNFISLIQVSILKIPRVRKFFNIDPLIIHDQKKLPIKNKGFVKGVQDSWTNLKISRELEDRQRVDEMRFMQAGRGAVKKTFKYDPTQRPPRSISAIEVKKRE